MRISVAMCTYNGAKYIQQQLNSILNQTMPVDEIVICDDGSNDETIEIINSIKTNTFVDIRLHINQSHFGFKKNFIRAINLCHGDTIFLSDQDDIWYPNKVAVIFKWFSDNPKNKVVFTDATLINDKGENINERLWPRFGFDNNKRRYFDHGYGLDIWAWSNRATGATMAFKKDFVEKIKWEDAICDYHDIIITLTGLANHCLGYIDKELIYYRLHDNQFCGAKDLPKELYHSPLKPCPLSLTSFDINFLQEQDKNHLEFIQQRYSFKYSHLSSLFKSISSYLREYKSWAYKFFFYDLFVSVRHRIKVVINKL